MAFHEQSLILDWLVPGAEARPALHARFQHAADAICAALWKLGADARVGELPGEYCPGQYSISIRGAYKVAGLAQRVYPHGAHIGAAIVVAEEWRLRAVLTPVYEALDLAWTPSTMGSLAAGIPGTTWDDVADALVAEFVSSSREP
jgi:hypothetical protein